MAEMMPPTYTGRYPSEKKVYELLKRLPNDCLVYYEARADDRYPDFVLIMPDLGVLVLEVKGWRAYQLLGADSRYVRHTAFGEERSAKHPTRQARGYIEDLQRYCQNLKWGECLIEKEGPYKGRFRFPFSYAVVLPNIARDELGERHPTFFEIFRESDTLTSDALEPLFALEGVALKNAFARYFARLFSCAMTETEIKVLRAVMDPVVVIDEPSRQDATDIKVLDTVQETKARHLPDGHQIIYGVAGSGKTVIAIARAKHLAEDAERKILLLCFNNLLAQYLDSKLNSHSNVSVSTFHGWAKRNGIEMIAKEALEDHARRFLDGFEHGMVADAGCYDAVIVDEAQLLPRDWLKCARLALREQSPDTASLLIVGDGTQSFFRKRPFTWKEAGIAASGRTTILKRNYRNTEEILHVAYRSATTGLPESEEGPRRAIPVPECFRNGPAPELITLRDRGEECEYAATLIRLWLAGGIIIRGRREPILPRDIAVLFPTPGPRPNTLANKLNVFTKAVVLQSHADRLDQNAVRIISIRRATGLQFRVVIILWADLLSNSFPEDDARALLYMAMTRAEDVLVILHSGTSELISRIGAALEANGSPAPG